MNIVYIITRSDTLGGANIHLLDLAEGVQNLGHQVTILIGGEGVVNQKARERGLNCISLENMVREINPIKDFKCFFEIKKHLLAIKPDIVHCHSSKAGILGRLVSYHLKIKNIFTAHGWAFTEGVSAKKALVYKYIEKYIAYITDRIITVSEYDRQHALKNGVSNIEQMITIHNGIKFLSAIPKKGEQVKIIMVARFSPQKKYSELIIALSHIKDLNWCAEFVGDGELKSEMEQLSVNLGLQERILFSGQCFDVNQRLANSDIFVLSSNYEGFPLTILEGMSHSLPIITSDVGGCKEAINGNGYLIPKGDVKYLADKLAKLIEDDNLRKDMGKKSYQNFVAKFKFETMLEKTIMVYSELVGDFNEK